MTKGRREGSRRHPNLDQTFMTAVHDQEGDVKTFVIEGQWSKRCSLVEGNTNYRESPGALGLLVRATRRKLGTSRAAARRAGDG